MASVLLNYVFKVDTIQPIPPVNTDFLRRVCVIAKPIDGNDEGYYTVTSREQLPLYTADTGVYSLFDAGMTSIYLLTTDTPETALADIAPHLSEFYTILITTQFEATEIDLTSYKGVAGYAFTSEADAKAFSVIENRVGFYTLPENAGKNMFFAFGKLLSGVSWRNQQYVQLPANDGILNEGTADLFFSDRVSFALSDSDFGNRLAFFTAGGHAITEPYIVQELTLRTQSRALTYLNLNQPDYTARQAILLADDLQKNVIDRYVDDRLIEYGSIDISVVAGSNYTAQSIIKIAEPRALWRIFANMQVGA